MPRPAYRPEYADQARKLCATFGASDWEIAVVLRTPGECIRVKDVQRWKLQHPEFMAACEVGMAEATAEVTRALFKLARGYTRTSTKRAKGVAVTIEEQVEPRLDAIKFWLINRGDGQWADEKSMVVKLPDQRPEDMTDAELARVARSDAAQPDHAG